VVSFSICGSDRLFKIRGTVDSSGEHDSVVSQFTE